MKLTYKSRVSNRLWDIAIKMWVAEYLKREIILLVINAQSEVVRIVFQLDTTEVSLGTLLIGLITSQKSRINSSLFFRSRKEA